MNSFSFSLRAIVPYLGELQTAVLVTLAMSLATIGLSLAIGLVFAVLRQSRSAPLRWFATAYVEFFRNTPLLVILYFAYFMMPVIGLRMSPFQSGLVGMTLHFGAYMTEILRAGLIAVPHGQYEAGHSQGMTNFQILRHIVLPQVIRTIYAPLGNQLITIILGSSLTSAIAVNDIAAWMQTTGSDTFRYFETFLIAAIVYAVLCQVINLTRIYIGRALFPDNR
ncbi:amino acid ABC transporter permease [Ancylobacter sp. MQZ15Z-1]|uniref:Amino acid ABC transporter permease n=1 Tax=Ancylobacter mangrovi TaxID=2972472 RepID=A0A9X2PAQ2_9HYPH|nr:amino acid ABC transporter permease [Ancylobacter mangrovi]MCS0494455.1 amino acid ABC transporter permease [Ancylobacter mangrovi]